MGPLCIMKSDFSNSQVRFYEVKVSEVVRTFSANFMEVRSEKTLLLSAHNVTICSVE